MTEFHPRALPPHVSQGYLSTSGDIDPWLISNLSNISLSSSNPPSKSSSLIAKKPTFYQEGGLWPSQNTSNPTIKTIKSVVTSPPTAASKSLSNNLVTPPLSPVIEQGTQFLSLDADPSLWNSPQLLSSSIKPPQSKKKAPPAQVIAVVDPSQIREINQQKVIITSELEEELTQQNLYKTELCRSFSETGACRYGLKCQFAHGREELRVIVRHPKYKTEICKTFHTSGACPYGTRCRFIHIKGKELLLSGEATLVTPPTSPVSESPIITPTQTPDTEETDSSNLPAQSLSSLPQLPPLSNTSVQWSTSWNTPATNSTPPPSPSGVTLIHVMPSLNKKKVTTNSPVSSATVAKPVVDDDEDDDDEDGKAGKRLSFFRTLAE